MNSPLAVTTGVPPHYQYLIKRAVFMYTRVRIYVYIIKKYIHSIICAIGPSRGRCGLSFYYAAKRKGNPSHKCRLVENNGCCVIVTNLLVHCAGLVGRNYFPSSLPPLNLLFSVCSVCLYLWTVLQHEGCVQYDNNCLKTYFGRN